MNIAVVSLGCPKNQVDADVFCRALIEDGHQTVGAVEQADVVIINTCGFIQSAKEEAIENILYACRCKEENPHMKVVVTGCLAERYKKEVAGEIPEVDAVVGIGSNAKLPQIVAGLFTASGACPMESYGPKKDLPLGAARVIGTPGHYAWLKVSEGCSNTCSFCAIPQIRGPLRSRSLESVVSEAKWLAQQGVTEIVLVAQDVTAFGLDRGEIEIVPLLQALEQVEGVHWVRLLYAYPERITRELLEEMARNTKVVPYLDLPIQHINDEVLASMRRLGNSQTIQSAMAMIREILPQATLRTTLIAGYPGESQAQFDELCAFVKQAGFDRLGCFAYSPEEGTRAARLPGQLDEETKLARADMIMRIQSNVMAEKQQQMVGKTLEIVCDEYDEEEGCWLCRSAADAPEIDVNVLVDDAFHLRPGCFYTARIVEAGPYDTVAEIL